MTIFLYNFLGFLIQLLPCVIMIFMPFPKEDYRFKRSNIFTCITAVSVIIAAIFSSAVSFRDLEKSPQYSVISNLIMLCSILLTLTAYILLVRGSLIVKLQVFFVMLFYAIAEYLSVNALYFTIFKGSHGAINYPYTEGFVVIYALYNAVLLPIMILLIINPLREYICISEPENIKREFAICTISMIVYFTVIIFYDTSYGMTVGSTGFFPFMFVLTINQIFIFWLIFNESVRRKRDSDKRQSIEIQQLQYEKIVREMESTRRMRHDIRHHYNTLADMLEKRQLDDMEQYLSSLIDTTVDRENEVYCKNLIINGLLQYYIAIAREEDISCTVHAVCGDINISPADLTVMFGNALENALLSCRRCLGKRRIDISIGMIQNSLAIEISNSCSEVSIDRRYQTEGGFAPAEAFISSHKGKSYGLRSIAHTALKYDGSVGFRFNEEKQTFMTRIRLNIQPDK